MNWYYKNTKTKKRINFPNYENKERGGGGKNSNMIEPCLITKI